MKCELLSALIPSLPHNQCCCNEPTKEQSNFSVRSEGEMICSAKKVGSPQVYFHTPCISFLNIFCVAPCCLKNDKLAVKRFIKVIDMSA